MNMAGMETWRWPGAWDRKARPAPHGTSTTFSTPTTTITAQSTASVHCERDRCGGDGNTVLAGSGHFDPEEE